MNIRKVLAGINIVILALGIQQVAFSGDQNGKLTDPDWIKDVNKPVVYVVPGMEQIKVQVDLTYKNIADKKLAFDVYSSISSNASSPVVIFIHGGPVPGNLRTQPKDWLFFKSYGQLIAASGFTAVTFNHRFYDNNSYIDAYKDIVDLITYLRQNAGSLGIDKNRIIPWVFSGGGALIAPILRESPEYIRGLVAYYPVLDLQSLRKYLPPAMTEATIKEYSPLFQLKNVANKRIPMMIVRAGLDSSEINQTIDSFVKEAKSNNLILNLSNHERGQHGFDGLNDSERSREIIKQTIEFVKAHSG